jgi:20S proteasome subunit alpha 7
VEFCLIPLLLFCFGFLIYICSTAVGIKCKDGIVLGVEKPLVSKMLVGGSNRRIFGINKTVGGVIAGLSADGRQIINRAREEAQSYKETYGHSIVPSVLANRLGLYAHFYTLHYSLRPFGE